MSDRHPQFGSNQRYRAAKELGNKENSSWITKQLKKALDPKDRDAVEV